jgi:hypothetical protein
MDSPCASIVSTCYSCSGTLLIGNGTRQTVRSNTAECVVKKPDSLLFVALFEKLVYGHMGKFRLSKQI